MGDSIFCITEICFVFIFVFVFFFNAELEALLHSD